MAFLRRPLEELLDIGYEPEGTPPIEGEGSELPTGVRMRRLGAYGDESHPMMDQLMEHIGALPSREDYAPSTLQRLLYGTVGLGQKDPAKGFETAFGYGELPFEQAVSDWALREKGLEKGAQLEGQRENYRSLREQRLAQILNNEERTKGYLSNLEDVGRHRRAQEEQAAAESERRAREGEERARQRGQALGLQGARLREYIRNNARMQESREKGLGLRREGLELRKKGGASKPKYTESQIDRMAVQTVLRNNPEYAAVIGSSGVPKQSPDKSTEQLFRGFNAELEKQKMILRNRYLGPNSLWAAPDFEAAEDENMPPIEEDEDEGF